MQIFTFICNVGIDCGTRYVYFLVLRKQLPIKCFEHIRECLFGLQFTRPVLDIHFSTISILKGNLKRKTNDLVQNSY